MNQHSYFIGAMSGTSLDGIEVALIAFDLDDQGLEYGLPTLVAHAHTPYTTELRDKVLPIAQGQLLSMPQLGWVDIEVARQYVSAITQLLAQVGMQAARISAVGAHGQTVYHQPVGTHPFTLQVGDGNTMAVGTGIPTVTDFRRRDVALGGQGAPLACIFHEQMFRHPSETRVVLNLGGIANLTILAPQAPTWGFDTGPANILMDAWIYRHQGLLYDAQGAWAASGQVDEGLLQAMMREPYFHAVPPKSTGRELFNAAWLDGLLSQHAHLAVQDVQRSLLELTARSVAQQLHAQAAGGALLVCGGGAHNSLLMARLQALCVDWRVSSTQAYGVAPDAMEAMAFAVFAKAALRGQAISLPQVTGARRACVLGNIFSSL